MNPPLIDDRNHLEKWRSELLDLDFVLEKARESGLLKRMRKLNPAYLLYVMIFGISCHINPSFEEIYRTYKDFDDTIHKDGKIRMQSFVKRFNEDMVSFLSLMLSHYIEIALLKCPAHLKKPVNNLKDIIIQDSTIIRLSHKLSGEFPAARYRGKAGGVKIHAVYSAIAHSLKSVKITGERVHDSKMMIIDENVSEKLFIFDLGYYSFKVFSEINNFGGFFISRLKTNATPKVITVISPKNTVKNRFQKGILLFDFLNMVPKNEVIDLVCSFNWKKDSKNNQGNENPRTFRVVCLWDENNNIWHTYVTNLHSDMFTSEEISHLYEYRWIIELFFKEMKSDCDLGHQLLAKSSLAYAHIYSMLIRIVISRELYKLIVDSVEEQEKNRYGPLLWSKIFAEKGKEFLSIVNQVIFSNDSVKYRWSKLELSLRRLARSRHSIKRLAFKYLSF